MLSSIEEITEHDETVIEHKDLIRKILESKREYLDEFEQKLYPPLLQEVKIAFTVVEKVFDYS